MKSTIWMTLTLLLASCSAEYRPTGCSWACAGPGEGATVPHCGATRFPVPTCETPSTRAAVTGETVEVRSAFGMRGTKVLEPNWLGWLVLEASLEHGDSGSGVYGADGALLGLVDHRAGGHTFAVRAE
jgi:hypothetical protein